MLRDPFTVVLDIWIILQLIWVTMLCAVQFMQISRNLTTYENMRGHSIDRAYPSSQALASALAAGTTSLDAAGLSSAGQGPNPTLSRRGAHHHGHGGRGCFQQLKTLLGIDAFFMTARDGFKDDRRSSRPRNPFSRGIVVNCRDFWCDPAPYFGERESGSAMLDGEIVNYNRMYETLRMHTGRRGGLGSAYRSLASEDPEANA